MGPNTCAHNSTYAWECFIKPDVDDKKKGSLKYDELVYEWFIPGTAFIGPKDPIKLIVKGSKGKRIELTTIKVDQFAADEKYWPRTKMSCNVSLVWTKIGKEVPQTSFPLTITVSPQAPGQ